MAEPELVKLTHHKVKWVLTQPADRNLGNRFSPELQKSYADFWEEFDRTATVSCERTIEEALHQARKIGDENNGMQALLTGSLHLISGALSLLES